ncbi:peptide chain release factor N(5)-glutamine methyltransferase [Reinekea marinisedimentorum]|uniref:Release factor glutamine methyltransferase n=1 Tax=Reinekea marinisedimentorum TaxID=230495 RepID=A0A4R3I7X9_9GAMM|nr:peptide chain release factor N(5)-glutamine methyltransferase [Reinekea marinisedimentorum]TCS41395.1 release factor glutamine methyltransferase [Reinekea marinisedimentorum]
MSQTLAAALSAAQASGLDKLDAEVLLAHVLEKGRTYLIAWPEKQLTSEQNDRYSQLVQRRARGVPVAYITGMREFWSLPIKTSPATLIPRPDTEVLVETVLEKQNERPLSCLDLGAGTGAIALALKSERPSWSIMGIDCIDEAIELASANARNLSLNVQFTKGNWCAGVPGSSLDIIVSNPPYIDSEDPHLEQGDVRFEPSSALVAPQSGFADIELIATQATRCLKPGGWLFLEHGWQQAERVRSILSDSGFAEVDSRCDYGGNERVTFGCLKNQ